MGASPKEERARKSQDPMRCAKAAMLLVSLGTCRDQQEKEMMKQAIDDLRMELVRERIRRKNLKLCNAMVLVLQILLMFSLCTFFLVSAFKFA